MMERMPLQRPCVGEAELSAVQRVFERGWLGMGPETQEFERQLGVFLGGSQVVAVSSGTAALHLALACLDLQADDEVIVPSLTFAASVQAILMAGARPVFCDVCADSLNIDVADARRRVTDRTRAILPVHYGGTACDMEALLALAAERGIRIVEDAAHAFGSSYHGRKIGSFGDVTCFSFDPIKNITCGEGGAVVTRSGGMDRQMRTRRVLGISRDAWRRQGESRPWSYDVDVTGYRYHMSDINAAIGLEQLKRFDAFKQRRQAVARRYDEAFAGITGLTLRAQHLDETVPFFYVLRVLGGRRDAFMDHCAGRGVSTGLHYIPNHLHRLFADGATSLPVCERVYEEMVTLPLFYEMTDGDVDRVVAAVREFPGHGRAVIQAVAQKKPALRKATEDPVRE